MRPRHAPRRRPRRMLSGCASARRIRRALRQPRAPLPARKSRRRRWRTLGGNTYTAILPAEIRFTRQGTDAARAFNAALEEVRRNAVYYQCDVVQIDV